MNPDHLARLDSQWLHDTLSARRDLLRAASLATLGTPKEIKLNGVTESFLLAVAILEYYFGQDWRNKYLTPDTAKPNFLRIDESDTISQDRTALRAIDLAEVIYNLQHVRGFDECIAKMKTGDIEDTYAELDLGRMLYLYKVPFRYVVPQGVRGMDYDIEVEYPDGVVACAEAKCTIENTAFRENAITNKLDDARKQLPRDRPGIIFVKMPPKWMDEGDFLKMTIGAAQSFLKGTRRVVSVKFYVSSNSIEDGYMKQQHAYKEISNPDTRFGAARNWNLFHQFDLPPEWNGMPPHWQRVLFFPDGKVR
jgi:hypothetical protein